MAMRQEQVVCLLAAGVLGLLVYGDIQGGSDLGGRTRGGRRASTQAVDLEAYPAPELGTVIAHERDARDLDRFLFEPPRDTRPLPLLAFIMPPRTMLPVLAPPTEPGPAARIFGALLRRDHGAAESVLGLFNETGAAEMAASEFATLGDPFAEPESMFGDDGEALPLSADLFSAQEIADRIASYQKLYDWIQLESLRFGHIQNADRFHLASRPNEPIEFMELDMATGKPRHPGQGAIRFERDRVEVFAFAQTIPNEIELRRLEFTRALRHGQYADVLAFADWCVEQRLVSPRALAVAEEMYTAAVMISDGEPEPRLGLARCYEAGFRFEEAFRVYNELVDGGLDTHPAVLARLGGLEARFRMFERARAHLVEGERYGRTSWEAQWGLGRFLLERGEDIAAVEHLEFAARYEPTAPDLKQTRAQIRYDLGSALLVGGRIAEARSWFKKALQADAGFVAGHAGAMACSLLDGSEPESDGARTSSFEGLLNAGLGAAGAGDWSAARAQLELAAGADPLRAYQAWRALSWIAERTGYPEEALRYIDLAHENDPTDVWTLYQRGRVLAARDDIDGARESLQAALDEELILPDALALLGELAFRQHDHEAAERYLERAVLLDAGVAAFHELRGMNHLRLGRVRDARDSLEAALEIDRNQAAARSALAWTFYASGDSLEAITRLRELDDRLRDRPEEDPDRAYAQGQIARIVEHEEKVAWTDRFERRELRNGWSTDETAGPRVRLSDGGIVIEGSFSKRGRARVFREELAGNFVSFEATVTVQPGALCRVGVFVSRERSRRGVMDVQNEIAVARHHDGSLQTRFLKRGEDDLPWSDVHVVEWKAGEPTILRLERHGMSTKTTFRLLVDGVPVADGVRVPGIGSTTEQLRFGIFCEGEPGRTAGVRIDDVEFIYRERD
jgi:tetratricopeptide (TPR) repeat protein